MTILNSQRVAEGQVEEWELTWILRGQTDAMEWPSLTSGPSEGEDGPSAVTVIIR